MMNDLFGMAERMTVHAPEMYALLRVWVNVSTEAILQEAKAEARDLLARIDGESEE